MTIKELESFYNEDKKEYIVNKNQEFIKWLKQKEKNNYHPFIENDEIQDLIDTLAAWYEIKYPDKAFDYYDAMDYEEFTKSYALTKEMTFESLLSRLTDQQVNLLACYYRASGRSNHLIKDKDDNVVGIESYVYIVLNEGKKRHLVYASNTGDVEVDQNIKKITSLSRLTLDDLYTIIRNKQNNDIDYHELSETIYDNLTDIELRNKILNMASLKLIYSPKSNPEKSFRRAKAFEDEFNASIPGLNLKTDLHNIMKTNYIGKEKDKQ